MTRRSFVQMCLGVLAACGVVRARPADEVVAVGQRVVDLPPVKTPTGEDRIWYEELYGVTSEGRTIKLGERWPHETRWRMDHWRERRTQ